MVQPATPHPSATATPPKSHIWAREGTAQGLIVLAFLAAVVGAVYGRAVHAPFIFDDFSSVVNNPSIVRLWPLVGDAAQPGPLQPVQDSATAGRPLVNFTLALNYHFGRLEPVGYHVFNLVVHVLAATLLWAIVGRTLRLQYFGGRFDRASGPLALAVALLWALHPLQTEAVIYVTQRTELLMGLCYLATLYGALRYWAATSRASRMTWLALAASTCLAGMASKEVMVSAPLMVLLFERTFITGTLRSALRKSWPLYLGVACGWMLLFYLNYTGPRSTTAGFHLGVPVHVWWFTQAKVLWMYLSLAVWPWPLVIHYSIPWVGTLGEAWVYLLPVGSLAIGTAVLLWRGHPVGYAGTWVFAILSPTLVVPIISEIAAERRMYLPLAALVSLVVVGGYAWTRRIGSLPAGSTSRSPDRPGPVAAFALSVLLLVLASCLVDVRRLAVFRDALSLWQDTLVSQPHNYVAHQNLSAALLAAGRHDEANEHYQQAFRFKWAFWEDTLASQPNNHVAYNNLGAALFDFGYTQQAIEYHREAVRLKPDFAEGRYLLALALSDTGQHLEAIKQLQRAVRLEPDTYKLRNNLGVILCSAGRLEEAIAQFRRTVELKPDAWEAHDNLGRALQQAGRFHEAIACYEQALRLKPDDVEIHTHLARAYWDANQPAATIAVLEKAVERARLAGPADAADQLHAQLMDYRARFATADGAASIADPPPVTGP